MPKRKLIAKPELEQIRLLTELGVPIARAIRRRGLDVSRPHLLKLMEAYLDGRTDIIFPPWLEDAPPVQEEPDTWVFSGRWP